MIGSAVRMTFWRFCLDFAGVGGIAVLNMKKRVLFISQACKCL